MTSPTQITNFVPSQPQVIKAGWNIQWSRQIAAYLFLLPAILLFAVFAWHPILNAVVMSFQNVSLTGETAWVGLENYQLMLKDPAFSIAWRNSLEFALWSIGLGFLFPVGIALLIREMRLAQGFFRIVYFLPTVVPAAIAVIVWRFIYDPDAGFLNEFLQMWGGIRQLWLQDAGLVKPSIVVMMTWGAFGTTALIYLSTLQEIPTELYEAAELDGANPWHRIRFVTLPHLLPIMSVLFIIQVIAVVQVFTEPFLMTSGGPGRETLTPALHIYNRAFIRIDLGYAAAWSVSLIVVLLVFSIIYRMINAKFDTD
ncbi:MAG: sugar ABC transporter permease [Anaerolineae bacterium]|nr:sugar ABC transporter permease [Anaerolineae bacterium]